MSVYVAAARRDANRSSKYRNWKNCFPGLIYVVCLRRVDWRITSGMSSVVADATAGVLFPPDSSIRDLKFVDDRSILVLLVTKGKNGFCIPQSVKGTHI